MLKHSKLAILCCFITGLHAMQNDQNAFADHMIAKWKDAGITTFDPFVLQENDWLKSDDSLDAIRYLPLRHKTYFQNPALREFFIKTCKQNPQEAHALHNRFTKYQTHLKVRLPELERKKLISTPDTQEINKFVTSTLDILHKALAWNDNAFMEGIIESFWQKEPDIMKLEPFVLNQYLMLEYDADAMSVLLNRNKRYLKNNVIRSYLIMRCQMHPAQTQKIKIEFLKYQRHMTKRLQELLDQDLIDIAEYTSIKEYISSVLGICDSALQKSTSGPLISSGLRWKTITVCAVVAAGIAAYFYAHAKAPQESTTK